MKALGVLGKRLITRTRRGQTDGTIIMPLRVDLTRRRESAYIKR